jgi:hypothetical protein
MQIIIKKNKEWVVENHWNLFWIIKVNEKNSVFIYNFYN